MQRTTVWTAVAVGLLLGLAVSGCVGDPTTKDREAADLRGKAPEKGAPFEEGSYAFDLPYSQVLAPGPYERLPPVRTLLKSAVDNVDIEVGYWLPKVPDGTKVPVLLHASPYHRPAGSVITNSGTKAFLNHNFLPYGYAVAAVSVRGTGDSGGCMEMFNDKERKDLSQAVTWLATQPWSNGNVGMTGLSYDGSTPWEVAAMGNPHLKTIVPVSGVNDMYGLMHKNGSTETRGQIVLNYAYYEYGWLPVGTAGGGSDANRAPEKRVQGFVCPKAWEGFGWSAYSTLEGGRDPNGFWADRNARPLVEKNYKGSILNVHGLEDWNVDPSMSLPWAEQLNASGIPVHQILGQWQHTHPDRKGTGAQAVNRLHRMDYAEKLLDWFGYWLKNETSIDLGPAVTVQDNTFRWRTEDHWPPRDANWTRLHLAGGNALVKEPTGTRATVTLLPNPVADNPLKSQLKSLPGQVADFYTAPFERTMNIAGLPRVHVTVAPHGATGHLAAWLYDVDASGVEKRIGWTTMNLRYYNGDEKAQTLTPRSDIVAKLEIQPMDARIEAGHRVLLRLWEYSSEEHIGGGTVPGVPPPVKDRNNPLPSAPVDVVFGGAVKSTLELPLVERPQDQYFRPPMPPGFKYPYET
ncbi:MAG TPA: CocE/NonD family hydrolase [Candidatus Thermoplasmatota archaeon]|nr:CocE/NonD family hydrolase [Candidatus Thermoplasmatota archaeon]